MTKAQLFKTKIVLKNLGRLGAGGVFGGLGSISPEHGFPLMDQYLTRVSGSDVTDSEMSGAIFVPHI